jgi:predicted MFS family arabinose efflux permease
MSQSVAQEDAPDGASGYGWLCLFVLFLVYTVHSIDRTIVSVLVEPIRQEFDLSDSQIGTLTGLAYALPAAITTLPLGALIDKTNRTRLLAGLLTLWSLFTGLGALAANYLSLLVTRVFVGAAEAGSANTCVSILSDYFPARQRPLAVSLFYLGGPAGALAGAYAVGAIAAAHGWRTALFVAMVPGLVLALVLLAGVREPSRGAKETAVQGAPDDAAFRDVFALLRREAGLRLVLLGVVISSTVASATATWFTALFMRRFDAPIAEAGLVTGISFGLCAGLGGLAGGLIAARAGRGETRRLLAILAGPVLLTIPVAGLAMLSSSQGVFVGLMMLFAFLSTMGPGTSYSLCASLAPAQVRGRLMAVVFLSANIVANGFGPQIIGWLSDLYHSQGPAHALSLAVMTLVAANLIGAAAFWLARAKLPSGSLGPLALR